MRAYDKSALATQTPNACKHLGKHNGMLHAGSMILEVITRPKDLNFFLKTMTCNLLVFVTRTGLLVLSPGVHFLAIS
ncbi:hypothetical protein CR513_11426, partial [Mucuna pruriens]